MTISGTPKVAAEREHVARRSGRSRGRDEEAAEAAANNIAAVAAAAAVVREYREWAAATVKAGERLVLVGMAAHAEELLAALPPPEGGAQSPSPKIT